MVRLLAVRTLGVRGHEFRKVTAVCDPARSLPIDLPPDFCALRFAVVGNARRMDPARTAAADAEASHEVKAVDIGTVIHAYPAAARIATIRSGGGSSSRSRRLCVGGEPTKRPLQHSLQFESLLPLLALGPVVLPMRRLTVATAVVHRLAGRASLEVLAVGTARGACQGRGRQRRRPCTRSASNGTIGCYCLCFVLGSAGPGRGGQGGSIDSTTGSISSSSSWCGIRHAAATSSTSSRRRTSRRADIPGLLIECS
mmetsp:Transcript_35761/g.77666  ORF Transcript_35761/g.77666 Transcript_35761/m.77666 type:complete len:255 (-) Transcript_35761:5-769(-)